MDKISQISDRSQIIAPKPAETTRTDAFRKALDSALTAGETPAGASAETAGPQAAGTLGEIMAPPPPQITAPGTEVAEKTESLLGLLDSFSRGLEDPGTSLKDMESLVTEMASQARSLAEEAGIHDPAIGGIAEEAAMLAAKEYIKFNRGDYV